MTFRFAGFCAVAVLVFVGACQPSAPPAAPETAAEATTAADVLVTSDGWVAATPNGATVAGGYVTISNNTDSPDALVGVSSSRIAHVGVHQMTMNGPVMEMRPVERIEIPAHGQAVLAPGGYHMMFTQLTAPLTAGETVPVTLTFEHHAPVELTLPVRDRAEMMRGAMEGMGHDQH